MISKKFDESLKNFVERRYIEDIDEDHVVFFVMFFVEMYCSSIYEAFECKERGRPRLDAKKMLTLILYCHVIKQFSPGDISEFTKTDSVFKLIMEGVSVSRTSVRRYREYFRNYYQEILSKTLLFAYDYGITCFNRVAIDGTILKACNAPFNYITKKDLRRLLITLKNERYGSNEVALLKKPAQKFYYNKNMTVEQKIMFLEEAKSKCGYMVKRKYHYMIRMHVGC
jgi:transposase